MFDYFLAIDIGASSGRHILGHVDNGKLYLEEIFRFNNGVKQQGDKLIWDHVSLFNNVIEGIKKCSVLGKIPVSIGIDTWGVDYALIDEDDNIIDEIYAYRDKRTEKVLSLVHSLISEKELYNKTGIRTQIYNTIYQLYCDKLSGKLKNAKSMLLMPDYLNFKLTGVKKSEYTESTTTGLINAKSRNWDYEIIDKLGLDRQLFNEVCVPGTFVGNFTASIKETVGFDAKVYMVSSHDTASAIMAVPNNENALYISSGTWSLMGIETQKENTTILANDLGFTNEGGYNKSITFLKNIMGLWMIQCVKKELENKYSFSDFVCEAKKVINFDSVVDVNDMSFFAPDSMIKAVQDYCEKTNQKVPKSVGEIVLCVYRSLAKCYATTISEIERISLMNFDTINIVGGGCQNDLLNELTAQYTGKKVVAGPVEATAIGNVLAQMIAFNKIKSINQAKEIIRDSFNVKEIIV